MSRQMCAIEYSYLADELAVLVGKRLSKISKLEAAYRFHIGDADILCQPPVRMHITKYIEESEDADGFVEKVRKEIKGARLEAVKQMNNDRILMFSFGEFQLYFEMFSKGNIILVKENKTVAAVRHEQWSDREIAPNKEYHLPKPPLTKLSEVISGKYVVVSLLRLPIGKEYAEEALYRAEIGQKTAGSSLSSQQIGKLEKTLEEMKKELKPCAFYENRKQVDFGLLHFSKYSRLKTQDSKTLSETADSYYFENAALDEAETVPEALLKLQSRLEKQKEHSEILKKEAVELKATGDWFYENYAFVDQLLKDAKAAGINNIEKLNEKYKIKEVNKEKKEIELEI